MVDKRDVLLLALDTLQRKVWSLLVADVAGKVSLACLSNAWKQ